MTNSYKSCVSLSAMVPGTNPRRDFGDIDVLAASIEATGGQPVNPPVVVADGDLYRIVDGERRWRALKRLHGDAGMADVLVFPTYDDAESAVAAMATDDKKALDESERARGFQRMLLLGVDERVVAKAARRKVADVRRAKAVATEAPEQATLDQMICAAEFEDEGDRKAVLDAPSDAWERKAETIRRRNEEAKVARELRQAIDDLGFDPLDKAPEGYESIMWADTADALRRLVEPHDDEELAVWPCAWNTSYWYVGHPRAKVEVAETPEQRKERETREREGAAVTALKRALFLEVATTDVMPHMQAAMGGLRTSGTDWGRDDLRAHLLDDLKDRDPGDEHMAEISERQAEYVLTSEASLYELAKFLHSPRLRWHVWVPQLLRAALDDDFCASEEDMWLLGRAEARGREDVDEA